MNWQFKTKINYLHQTVSTMAKGFKESHVEEDLVEYRALYPRKDTAFWVRPAKMFFETISATRKGNITGQTKRFELVEELSKDYINETNK